MALAGWEAVRQGRPSSVRRRFRARLGPLLPRRPCTATSWRPSRPTSASRQAAAVPSIRSCRHSRGSRGGAHPGRPAPLIDRRVRRVARTRADRQRRRRDRGPTQGGSRSLGADHDRLGTSSAVPRRYDLILTRRAATLTRLPRCLIPTETLVVVGRNGAASRRSTTARGRAPVLSRFEPAADRRSTGARGPAGHPCRRQVPRRHGRHPRRRRTSACAGQGPERDAARRRGLRRRRDRRPPAHRAVVLRQGPPLVGAAVAGPDVQTWVPSAELLPRDVQALARTAG